MNAYNEQIRKYLDLQHEAFGPFRAYSDIAVQAFQRLVRQNYAVLGDCIDFAFDQAHLPGQVTDVQDYFDKRIASTRALGEKLAQRTQEYAEITRSTLEAVAGTAVDARTGNKADEKA